LKILACVLRELHGPAELLIFILPNLLVVSFLLSHRQSSQDCLAGCTQAPWPVLTAGTASRPRTQPARMDLPLELIQLRKAATHSSQHVVIFNVASQETLAALEWLVLKKVSFLNQPWQ